MKRRQYNVNGFFRFEKRHKNMSVHLSPCFRDVMVGDVVTVGECRYVHCKDVFRSGFIISFQTPVQDGQVQHPQGDQGRRLKEIFHQVLSCDDIALTLLSICQKSNKLGLLLKQCHHLISRISLQINTWSHVQANSKEFAIFNN